MSDAFHSDHRRLDERSLALHAAVAEKIQFNPALVEKARANLSRWRTSLNGSWLDEWQAILDGPIEGVIACLRDRSERAVRLRQSSPFAGLLSAQERRAIYESFRVVETGAACICPV